MECPGRFAHLADGYSASPCRPARPSVGSITLAKSLTGWTEDGSDCFGLVSVLDPEASLTAADVIVPFEDDGDCEEEERGVSLTSPDERGEPRSSLLLELDELGFSAGRLLDALVGSPRRSFSFSFEAPEEDELPCDDDLALACSFSFTASAALSVTGFSTTVR